MSWSTGAKSSRADKSSNDNSFRSIESTKNAVSSKNTCLGAAYDDTIVFVSNLKELSVQKISFLSKSESSPFYSPENSTSRSKSAWNTLSKDKLTVALDTEPSVIAIGSDHIAAGLNTIVWYYALPPRNDWTFPSAFREVEETPVVLTRTMEYVAIVKDIRLNSQYAVVLFTDGRIHLHSIEPCESQADDIDDTRINSHRGMSLARPNSNSSFLSPRGGYMLDSDLNDRLNSASSVHSPLQVDDEIKEREKLIEGRERYTCIDLTDQLLIYASLSGVIEFFHLRDWTVVDVYRHTSEIRCLAADTTGTKIGVIDENNKIIIYNSVTGDMIDVSTDHLPTFPTHIRWDKLRPQGNEYLPSYTCSLLSNVNDLFILYDNTNIYIHCFIKQSISGKSIIQFIDTMNSSSSDTGKIIHLLGSMIYSVALNGRMNESPLVSHGFVLSYSCFTSLCNDFSRVDRSVLGDTVMYDLLKLRRYSDVYKLCEYLNEKKHWKSLGDAAIHDVQLDLAIHAYKHIHPEGFGMVLSLKSIVNIEEKNLLTGHLAVFLGEYELAQQLFLNSSHPEEALYLRQHLQDWQTALVLAKRLSPHSIPVISREYASQLELTQDYDSALVYYEKALDLPVDSEQDDQLMKCFNGSKDNLHRHQIDSSAGIARNSLRMGNTSRALEILSSSSIKNHHHIQLECAKILESMRLYSDAASVYENAREYKKAAQLYLQMKNVNKVSKLLDLMDQSSQTNDIDDKDIKLLLIEYAKIQENEHRYKEAQKAYEKAGDTLQVIRILLEKIRNPSEAMRLARESNSLESKMKIAKFFQSIGEIPCALEFLVLSHCNSEAFQLASASGHMDSYANYLLEFTNNLSDQDETLLHQIHDDMKSIALYYESEKNLLQAGKFYYLSGNIRKGVKLLLASIANRTININNEPEAIELAIEAAAKCKDDSVVARVIDFLVGDVDGVARDFKYLFRLYMKLGHYKDAAKTAVTIANEEIASGNYRSAHTMLFKTSEELAKHQVRMPSEMASLLLLIHSYFLSKVCFFLSFSFVIYQSQVLPSTVPTLLYHMILPCALNKSSLSLSLSFFFVP